MIQQRVNFYRLHFINRKTGTIGHTYEFHAEDGEAAMRFAEVWAAEAPMELWGRQLIRRWGPPQGNDS